MDYSGNDFYCDVALKGIKVAEYTRLAFDGLVKREEESA